MDARWVAVDVASLHAEPDEHSEQVTQVLAGEPVRVLEQRGSWLLLQTRYAYQGWVAAGALSSAPAGEWLPEPRAGQPAIEARVFLGTPYLWGGMTQRGIDCSGLVHMAYRRLGRLVPRDARDQERSGEAVEEPRTGDLITYGEGEEATHIAFWLGGGRILHASSVRGVVEEDEPEALRAARRRFLRASSLQLPRTS